MKKLLQKPFILPAVVLIAILGVIVSVKNKTNIVHQTPVLTSRVVEVIRAKLLPYRARAVAYGYVTPAISLTTKAEVSGKISYIHPELAQGASLSKDTLVLKIEPTKAQFSLDQDKAGLSGSRAALNQLKIEEKTTASALKLAKSDLKLGRKEFNRLKALAKKGVVSQSRLDTEDHRILQLRQKVADLAGKISGFRSRKSALNAQIKQSKTKLSRSKDNLKRTEIYLPFNARIGAVFVDKSTFVSIGNPLFEALGTKAVEINADLPVLQFQTLIANALMLNDNNLDSPAKLNQALMQIQLAVVVSLVSNADQTISWQGRLSQVGEAVNPTRNTVNLTILVDNPYQDVQPGKRPPLIKGMFTAVQLLAPAKKQWVLPRRALHQGRIYVVNTQNKLEIRQVKINHQTGRLIIIEAGLKAGEQIIINDLIPVIDGLPVKAVVNEAFEQQLARDALAIQQAVR